jgi:hypothetical protein
VPGKGYPLDWATSVSLSPAAGRSRKNQRRWGDLMMMFWRVAVVCQKQVEAVQTLGSYKWWKVTMTSETMVKMVKIQLMAVPIQEVLLAD